MKAQIRHIKFLIFIAFLFTLISSPICQAVVITPIYVDKNATGANNGLSWSDAYTTIAAALSAATTGKQIWVKAGTYTESITLKSWVDLYGGFAGTETDLNQRDWANNVTTIDGQNSVLHVVTGADDATIDGFTITGGNANGTSAPDDKGGGMLNDGVSPTVANCIFTGNSSNCCGAGMCNYGSMYPASPTVTNCMFKNNTASGSGGGMCNYVNASPTVTNCTFKDNSALSGGGMYNLSSSPTITNCIFSGNSGDSGGGGGMYNEESLSPSLMNCTFTENSTLYGYGGGMYNSYCATTVTNSIFWGDTALSYPEIYNYGTSPPTFSYSDIEGCGSSGTGWVTTFGTDGGGNIDADPLFALGDNYHHLQAGSACIDAGTSSSAPADDFEGDERYDDPDTTNTGAGTYKYYDIGADEYIGAFWTQVNEGDFDANSKSAYRMAVYNDKLYVGIFEGAEVWEYGSAWTKVTPSWDANNAGVNSMAVYNDKLYVGTYSSTGTEVWEYGSSWNQVNSEGFGSSSNYAADSMAVYNDKLYAGVGNASGVGVWRYDGGTTWTQVNTVGFGDGYNYRAYCMAVYNGKLYVGIYNSSTGAQVWEYDGSTWTNITTTPPWGSANYAARSMAVYNGKLYVGTENSSGAAEVWEYDGSTWTNITATPPWGSATTAAAGMANYNAKLYMATYNSSAGAGVWEYDGSTWSQVNTSGFGDPENNQFANGMAVYDNRLYVGTRNNAEGAEIWKYVLSVVTPTQYGLTVTTVGQGTVTLNPSGSTFDQGTVVTLTAAADSGWTFSGWSGDLTGSTNPETITMDSNKSVTATFVALDSDGDGMPDTWEITYFGDLTSHDGTADSDSDGLTDLQEYQKGTDPNDSDSDNDGYYDGEEVGLSTDPSNDADYPSYSPGTYYINILSGNDLTGNGTSDTPWKTLHHALYRINGGSAGSYSVNLALGTYNVANGEANDSLTITQDNVTIIGESGSSPVLDGTDASMWGYGIGIDQDADSVRIYNLELANFPTAGLLIEGTGASVKNCNVHDNGTGLWIESTASDATIKDNQIHENGTGYYSIGVWVRGASGVTVARNQIYTHEYYGIGVESCSPAIQRNEIYGNQWSGIDIWAYTQEASPQITNNIIYSGASGITMSAMDELASPGIYHNTIDAGTEDGIYCHGEGATPDVKYNTITNFEGYGINNTGGSPTIEYNDVYGNTTGQYGGDTSNQTGINGNISQDPLYGSYELQSGSPCIDAIPTDSTDPVTVDYAGYARPKGSGYDIGAYEFITDIAHEFALPGGTGEATDYQMFTVPVTLASGSSLRESMESALGIYDKGIWRVFAWDPDTSSYIEMDDPSFADLEVYPGRGFWVISTSTDTITFSGQPAPDGDYTEVPLSPGWNMVALPWPATSIELDNIAVSDGPNSYWITSANNTLTQQYVWDYTGTGANNGYEQRASGATLQPGTAYWIKVEAAADIVMLVPKDNEGGHFTATSMRSASEAFTTPESTEQPPPPPGLSVSFNSTSSDGGTRVSGSAGCFIEIANSSNAKPGAIAIIAILLSIVAVIITALVRVKKG